MVDAERRRLAQRQGLAAELHVAELLQADGWRVLEHGWRCKAGEIDLIVQREGALRFVEVKARSLEDPSGIDAVGLAKQRRVARAAERYLDERRAPFDEAAFMVALVALQDGRWDVELIDDAFDGC
jgi:putative endonuclease